MDGDKASRFVSSLVKSIQALCNGYIDFSSSIEVIGHIHLNIDRSVKLDYVLTEEVSKSISEGATVFASHSYHSHPPSSLSSKSASDASGRHRQKQQSIVSHGEEEDTSNFRSLGSEVHNTSGRLDSHSHKRSSESYTDSGESISTKHENRQKSSFTQETSERRRRSIQSQPHQSSPAAKRSRQSDYNADIKPQEYEVIEIKEEPDDEPSVFFGNNSTHLAAGQDLQTPDFSNVVMESLDRVGQVEGTNLVGGGDGGQMQQQQPFPVMMHANSGMPASSASSSGPGPSLSDPQDQSFASTSGKMNESKVKEEDVGDTSTSTGRPVLRVRLQPLWADLLTKKNTRKKKTAAETGKAYRERLKANPEVFRSHRTSENARIKAYIANLPEDKKKMHREKIRLRVQKCRAKKKAEGRSSTLTKPKLTEDQKEKMRNAWKLQKLHQRQTESAEQKAARNQHRREIYAQKKKKLPAEAAEKEAKKKVSPKTVSTKK